MTERIWYPPWQLADGSFNKRGMSLPAYLRMASQLARGAVPRPNSHMCPILTVDAAGLTVHHTIEERHIFPILAKRMTMFQNDDVHLKSHEAIHHGQCRPS